MECFSTTEVISVLPSIEWLHFVAAESKERPLSSSPEKIQRN